MKVLFDFFPLLVFFAAWWAVDIFFATAAAMVATTIQVIWSWLKHRKVEKVLSRGRVVIDGGEYLGSAGHGRFVKRDTCGYLR